MGKKKLATTKKVKPPKFTIKDDNGKKANLTYELTSESEKALFSTFGIDNHDAIHILLTQLMGPTRDFDTGKLNGTVSMLADIAPQNGLEGMLAVQMVAAHNMAMTMAARAMHPDQTTEGVNDNITRAHKMMKTFVSQTEALAKLRGNTKTVTIKHVNVNAGGQAIIGDVLHGRSDGKK